MGRRVWGEGVEVGRILGVLSVEGFYGGDGTLISVLGQL